MGGRVKVYPWAWFEDWFFFLVLRCLVTEAFQGGKNSNHLPSISFFDSPFLEGLLRYIFPFHWSWPSICWSCRLLLECLSHLLPSSTCCELQQPMWYCSGVISSLMWPDRQLWAFNAEVTASHGIDSPPWFHGWPTVLVLFAWDAQGGCLQGRAAFSSVTSVRRGQDCPQQRLLAVWTFFIRPQTFLPPRRGTWAWYEMGWSCQILWPHTSNTNVLMH